METKQKTGEVNMQGAMAFKLPDGSIFYISDDFVSEIAREICLEAAIGKDVTINITQDNNAEKAQQLYKILAEQKDMQPETRYKYHNVILELLANKGKETKKTVLKITDGETITDERK